MHFSASVLPNDKQGYSMMIRFCFYRNSTKKTIGEIFVNYSRVLALHTSKIIQRIHAKHAYSALVNFSLSLYLYLCFTLSTNFAEFDADFESVEKGC